MLFDTLTTRFEIESASLLLCALDRILHFFFLLTLTELLLNINYPYKNLFPRQKQKQTKYFRS